MSKGDTADWSNMFFQNRATPMAGWDALGTLTKSLSQTANDTQGQKNLAYGGKGYRPFYSYDPEYLDQEGPPTLPSTLPTGVDPNNPAGGAPPGGGGAPPGGPRRGPVVTPPGQPPRGGEEAAPITGGSGVKGLDRQDWGGVVEKVEGQPAFIGGPEWAAIVKSQGGDVNKAKAMVEQGASAMSSELGLGAGGTNPYAAFGRTHDAGQTLATRLIKGNKPNEVYHGTNVDGSKMTQLDVEKKQVAKMTPEEYERYAKIKGAAALKYPNRTAPVPNDGYGPLPNA